MIERRSAAVLAHRGADDDLDKSLSAESRNAAGRYDMIAAAVNPQPRRGAMPEDEAFVLHRTGMFGDDLVAADIGGGELIWACRECATVHAATAFDAGCPLRRGGPDRVVTAP